MFMTIVSIFFSYIISQSKSLKLDEKKIISAISQVGFYDGNNENINGNIISLNLKYVSHFEVAI